LTILKCKQGIILAEYQNYDFGRRTLMSVKEKVSGFALDKAINYISGDPETNIPKLLGLLDSLGIKSFEPASRGIHSVLDDTDGVWYKFIMDLWRDIDNDVLKSVDQMIEWGAKFCWFFTYMPVGKEAVPELMVSAEQREFMYH